MWSSEDHEYLLETDYYTDDAEQAKKKVLY